MCTLDFCQRQVTDWFLNVASIHGPISDSCFVPYRKVVDGLGSEVVESHFFSVRHSGNAERKLHLVGEGLVIGVSVT